MLQNVSRNSEFLKHELYIFMGFKAVIKSLKKT